MSVDLLKQQVLAQTQAASWMSWVDGQLRTWLGSNYTGSVNDGLYRCMQILGYSGSLTDSFALWARTTGIPAQQANIALLPYWLFFAASAPFRSDAVATTTNGGSWYNVANTASLFQDDAGTIPVTADGQTVGRISDLSGNNRHLVQATALNAPVYRTAGGKHWLDFSGTQFMRVAGTNVLGTYSALTAVAAITRADGLGARRIIDNNIDPVNVGFNSWALNVNPANNAGLFNALIGTAGVLNNVRTTTSFLQDAPVVLSWLLDREMPQASEHLLRLNGVEQSKTTAASNDSTGNFNDAGLSLGADVLGGNAFNGRLYQLFLVPSVLSASAMYVAERSATLST